MQQMHCEALDADSADENGLNLSTAWHPVVLHSPALDIQRTIRLQGRVWASNVASMHMCNSIILDDCLAIHSRAICKLGKSMDRTGMCCRGFWTTTRGSATGSSATAGRSLYGRRRWQ